MNALLGKIRTTAIAALAAALAGTAALAQDIVVATGQDPSLGAFYVARDAGIFEKHGLNVRLESGPAGSAMVSLLIKNQVQAALAAEQAGILNYNIDKDVVVVAQGSEPLRYFGLVARNVAGVEDLKGKKIGVTIGSASEVFWRTFISKLNLNADDYTVVPVDPPEMMAALERGNIDAAATWEPWMSRMVEGVSDTAILRDNEGIFTAHNLVYFNRTWAEANPETARTLLTAIIEAADFIREQPDEAAKIIAAYLRMDVDFTRMLMTKYNSDILLDQGTIDSLRLIETQLVEGGKLPAEGIDWAGFIHADILKSIAPDKVDYQLPQN
ncbi:ABC transporter substrate-binding protein [Pseudochelatococcus sp. B33]